jgi:sugar/nucleoside kinase (ribokinase family)
MDIIATFGALLFSSDTPKSIGLIVKAGHDFPLALEQTFNQWNVDLHIIRESGKPSSRGRIVYGHSSSERTYQRLTSPLPSTIEDLTTTNMISAACFHFFDIPETVNAQIDQISALRAQQGIDSRPLYVWEPQAKSCSPETFEHHKKVVEKVDIFSPNHAELASFFAQPVNGLVGFDKTTVEEQARKFMPASPSNPLCILIRCAEHGCFLYRAIPNGEQDIWLPAYHLPGSEKVVDTTGAGNAFLGGAAVGYLQHHDFGLAAAYGSVAASFAVETVGLPDVSECDAEARLITYVDWVNNLSTLQTTHSGS